MNYFTPSASPPLPDEVRAALAEAAPEVRQDIQRIWAEARPSEAGMPSDAEWRAVGDAMWSDLEAALRADDRGSVAPARDRAPHRSAPLRLVHSTRIRGIALAACIALLVAVGLFWWQQPVSVTAPAGEIVQVTLPDGSTVALNSGSTIAYTGAYGGQRRTVRLVGEGFFDVVPDAAPFVVETFNGATTVLGTSFNVRAWPDDPDASTTVAVVSGVVRLAAEEGEAVTLEAGDAARLAASAEAPVALDETPPENALAWRRGGFKFTGVPLGTIVTEVERRYDVEIEVTEPSLLNDPVVLLIEKSLGAEQILRDICEYNGYDYRATADGFVIYRPASE
jgi:ferric-dicitrate binding protein FerR (iron transport regulator)